MGKKPDIDAKKASKMSPKQILGELKKGKTVSGYDAFMEEHHGKSVVKDVSVKDIEKQQKRMGSFDYEGTVKSRPGGGTMDSLREIRKLFKS